MYAIVRTYESSPELADALVARQDDVKQLISEIDGFEAYYLVRTPDGAVSVSVYDDEAGAHESTRRAAAWVGENLAELAVAPPRVAAGEVVVDF
jgi:heme-degrading monooxygenase HmoA